MTSQYPTTQKPLSRNDFLQIISLLIKYSNKIDHLKNMCEKFKNIVRVASQLQEHYNYEGYPFFPLELDIRLLEAEEVLRKAEELILFIIMTN